MNLKEKIDELADSLDDNVADIDGVGTNFKWLLKTREGQELLRWVAEQASQQGIDFMVKREPYFYDWWAKFGEGK